VKARTVLFEAESRKQLQTVNCTLKNLYAVMAPSSQVLQLLCFS